MLEASVKQEIKDYLDSLGERCWYYCPVPMGYGKRGVPDFIICYRGFFLAPETKRPKGGVSTAMQDRQQQAILLAGGYSGRVTEVQKLKNWVAEVDDHWQQRGQRFLFHRHD